MKLHKAALKQDRANARPSEPLTFFYACFLYVFLGVPPIDNVSQVLENRRLKQVVALIILATGRVESMGRLVLTSGGGRTLILGRPSGLQIGRAHV